MTELIIESDLNNIRLVKHLDPGYKLGTESSTSYIFGVRNLLSNVQAAEKS
jgi:hypothetical protein